MVMAIVMVVLFVIVIVVELVAWETDLIVVLLGTSIPVTLMPIKTFSVLLVKVILLLPLTIVPSASNLKLPSPSCKGAITGFCVFLVGYKGCVRNYKLNRFKRLKGIKR